MENISKIHKIYKGVWKFRFMSNLDEKDIKILNLLKQNAKLATQQISKKTLIPITTVHNRIKKLEQDGIIKNYTVNLDHKQLGKNLSAYILIQVDTIRLKARGVTQKDLLKEIYSKGIVESISVITGDFDIIAKVLVEDMDKLDDFVTNYLRIIDGVRKTQTLAIFNELS